MVGGVDALFTDYARAFVKAPHKRFIKELQGMEVAGKTLTLIEHFLIKRMPKVLVNGKSKWADITSRVPQRSVLGPLLFVCFINDLPDTIHTNVRKNCADDRKLFPDVSRDENVDEVQNDITRFFEGANKWQL